MSSPRSVLRLFLLATMTIVVGCATDRVDSYTIDFETEVGTDLAFDVSPDGRTIVFDLLGQLWTLPVEGGRAVPLTDAVRDSSEDLHPVISPDGKTIAFVGERPGSLGLFTLSLEDGSVQRLTTGWHLAPSWSSDGRELAYVDEGTIQLLDISTGESRELQIDSLSNPAKSDPAWSPVDDRLVFVNAGQDKGRGGAGRLWEVSREGGIARPLAGVDVPVRGPAFSPDGSRLAFFARDSADRYQLWVKRPDEEPVRLTSHEDVTYLRARWVGDASRILYHADGRLWTVPAAGGDPTEVPFTARIQLTRKRLNPRVRFTTPGTEREARGHMGLALSPGGSQVAVIALGQLWVFGVGDEPRAVAALPKTAAGLSWSPDESAVVWCAGRGGGEDLYATDLSTGSTRQITALAGSETAPAWSPDGRYIAFIHWEPPALSEPPSDWVRAPRASRRLRVIPAGESIVESVDATTDLGVGPGRVAPMWSPDSQPSLLFVRGGAATLVSLNGDRRELPISELSPDEEPKPNPANLLWPVDGQLMYVEDGLLWRAAFDSDSAGLGVTTRVSDDAALYASASRDGSVLYVSPEGLRIRRPSGQAEDLGWPLTYRTPAPAPPLLIQNVRVITGTDTEPDAPVDVLIEGGRIVRFGPAGTLAAADEIRVVDAGGRTAIPGLIDAHTHLWDDAVLPGMLYYGVTTYRDMGANGVARLVGHRDAIEAGLWSGPRIVSGGVMFTGTGRWTGVGTYEVSDDSARARAMSLMAAFGADYLKQRLFRDWAGAAKLVEAAHAQGWTTSGHIALPLPIIAAGIDGMEHLGPSGYRTHEIVYGDIIQLFRRADMWVVPTVIGYSFVPRVINDPSILDDPEAASFITPSLRYRLLRMPTRLGERYKRFVHYSRVSAKLFHEGGVAIAAGTDVPHLPWALHAEMEELVDAGFTPAAAIAAATSTAARALGASDEIGTLEEGKWADLVILNSDPLEDIRNTRDIWMVIKGGAEVDREALRSWAERSEARMTELAR